MYPLLPKMENSLGEFFKNTNMSTAINSNATEMLGSKSAPISRSINKSTVGTVIAIICVSAVFLIAGVSLKQTDPAAWEARVPEEGLNWAVAKYQIEFMRLRLELNLARQKNSYALADIMPKIAALEKIAVDIKSKANNSNLFQSHPISSVAKDIANFQGRLERILLQERGNESNSLNVIAAIIELESLDSALSIIGKNVAEEERARRETALAGMKERLSLMWMILVAAWAGVILWLVSFFVSSRKKHRAQRAEIKALQAQRQAVFEKDAAVQEKSRFLSSISHELRSSLQSICSAIEMLELDIDDTNQKNISIINRIKRATTALLSQLQDLLTLARGEAGKLEIHPTPFEANELIADIAQDFQDAANEKNIFLHINVPQTETFVIADPIRIRQVFTNLMSNAIKYTDRGGVSITLRPYDMRKGILNIAVTDTGRGIPNSALGSIFNQYERLGVTETHSAGSGVGLAIVRTVASMLGAKIKVNSIEGHGTQFSVEIPVTPQPLEIDPVENDKWLLIVDDRPEILKDLVALALRLNLKVDSASTAAEAANMLAAKRYHVVMLDMDLGEKNGKELAAETRNGDGPNKESCIIAFSAADGNSFAQGWPFDGFLQKPIYKHAMQSLFISPPIGAHKAQKNRQQSDRVFELTN